MKRITTALLATAAAAGLMSSAYAADLIIEEPVVDNFAVSDVWSGAYVGAHVGWGWGNVDVTEANGDLDDIGSYSLTGWLAGVQAGANVQMDNIVFGVEGDIAWTDITGDSDDADEDVLGTDIKWLGTVRGRLGFAADTFLLYGTAGVAFAGVDSWMIDTWDPETFTISDTRFGWVVGVGAEAMVAENVSLKAEVLYHDFGAEDFSFDDGDETATQSLSVTTFKVGVNFHF